MSMPELYPWQQKFLDEYMAARERGETPRIVMYQGRSGGRKWVEQKVAEFEALRAVIAPSTLAAPHDPSTRHCGCCGSDRVAPAESYCRYCLDHGHDRGDS